MAFAPGDNMNSHNNYFLSMFGRLKPGTTAAMASADFARVAVREREVAVRTALGATRSRLARQLLTESVVLAAAGGVAALVVAYLSVDGLNLLSQRILPRAEAIRIDPAVMAFTLGAS